MAYRKKLQYLCGKFREAKPTKGKDNTNGAKINATTEDHHCLRFIQGRRFRPGGMHSDRLGGFPCQPEHQNKNISNG